jgi:membrane protein YqaA with SNARE-associated domain
MLRKLYDRTLALSASPRAPLWLALVAFAEASCFPIPPDVLLIPMALARPRQAWRFAAICTVASVVGGALGYFIGYAVFVQLARPLIRFYGYGDRFAAFQALYAQYGLWVILIKGLTPIPYKIVTIASGAAHFNFWVFMAASAVTRGMRFFLVAALLRAFGASVRDFIERRLALVTGALAAGVVGGFLLLKLM